MPRVNSLGSSSPFLPTQNGVQRAPSSASSLPRLTPTRGSALRTATSSPSPYILKKKSNIGLAVPELPVTNKDIVSPTPARSSIVRAAVSGSGSLLPDFTPSGPRNRAPPNRFTTRSSPSLKQVMNLSQVRKNPPQLPQTQQDIENVKPKSSMLLAAKQSLRRRTYSSTQTDEDYHDDNDHISVTSHTRLDSPYRPRGRRRAAMLSALQKVGRLKLGHLLQVIIVLAVTSLVWESHHKALFAAEQLVQFREEENLLLLHLQKIEQQSLQLHENMRRLAQSGARPLEAPPKKDVDYDLIHKQAQQLYQMEQELNNEVQTLQKRIQRSARNHIVSKFGEGPIQIILELDFGDNAQPEGSNAIHILLWHDTPHAAWAWLEQIGRHVWDGAQFDWQQGHVLDAFPTQADPSGSKLEFVESSEHSHEPWTVGIRESPDSGRMTIYVNLQDNRSTNKDETCVGKVIDGFSALQRLLEVARKQERDGDNAVVRIKKATATHVAKKE